jgi:hypothetical protein
MTKSTRNEGVLCVQGGTGLLRNQRIFVNVRKRLGRRQNEAAELMDRLGRICQLPTCFDPDI